MQLQAAHSGTVASVVGNLNFNVVVSLHRILHGLHPPQLIDLKRCTGADHAGVDCLLLAREQGISLMFDASDRIAALLQRPLSKQTRDAAAAVSRPDSISDRSHASGAKKFQARQGKERSDAGMA